MTALLPPADIFASTNAATLKAFGAGSVKVTAPDTVEVSFDDLVDRANADSLFQHSVNGVKVLYTTTDGREIAPVVDARSAAAFLKQHPGVSEVIGYQVAGDQVLVMPGTVDGVTALALNALLDTTFDASRAVPVASARPASATSTFPIGELPPVVDLG